jgi:GT2 family glycosyltransferase
MAVGPRVAVVVPVFNKIELTLRFLQSFKCVTYPNYSMIIVDDGSTDGTAQVLQAQFPEVIVLKGDGNLWWSGGTNLGVSYALEHNYDYVLTINNDSRVSPQFLTRLLNTALAHPRSIVGCRINFLEEPTKVWGVGGRIEWSTGIVFHLLAYGMEEKDVLPLAPSPWRVAALPGCGALVPIECFREVGLYDAERFPQYHGDAEFTFRAGLHGYNILVDLDAVVWNDAKNTSTLKSGWRYFFSKRSPGYWRPVIAIHLLYCPREFLYHSLWNQYPRYRSGLMRYSAVFLAWLHLLREGVKNRLRSLFVKKRGEMMLPEGIPDVFHRQRPPFVPADGPRPPSLVPPQIQEREESYPMVVH